MNRITVEQVKDAYAKTGLKVLNQQYSDPVHNAACPLSVCAMAADGDEFPGEEDVIETLALHPNYVQGFVEGFDSDSLRIVFRALRNRTSWLWDKEQTRLFVQGLRDGRRVRRHVPAELTGEDYVSF
jgi:hypothetical protein